MKNSSPSQGIHSISKALSILLTFTAEEPYLRVSDIASKLNMTPSTVSRHLNTMLDMDFIARDDATGSYHLSNALISLSGIALSSYDIYRHAYPETQRLSTATSLHTYLGVPYSSNRFIYLASVGGTETMDLFTPIGQTNPLYCTAIGKIILANKSPNALEHYLKTEPLINFAPNTITNPERLKKALCLVRTKGYATICDEFTPGKASVAAPIFNRNHKLEGAISVSGSIDQVELDTREKELARIVVKTANKISGYLGYHPR